MTPEEQLRQWHDCFAQGQQIVVEAKGFTPDPDDLVPIILQVWARPGDWVVMPVPDCAVDRNGDHAARGRHKAGHLVSLDVGD